jgi:hydroxymethylpyrimidine pyrophosphatase-like HAD family hydrolase
MEAPAFGDKEEMRSSRFYQMVLTGRSSLVSCKAQLKTKDLEGPVILCNGITIHFSLVMIKTGLSIIYGKQIKTVVLCNNFLSFACN